MLDFRLPRYFLESRGHPDTSLWSEKIVVPRKWRQLNSSPLWDWEDVEFLILEETFQDLLYKQYNAKTNLCLHIYMYAHIIN